MKTTLVLLTCIVAGLVIVGLGQIMPERHGVCDTRGSIAATLNCQKVKP